MHPIINPDVSKIPIEQMAENLAQQIEKTGYGQISNCVNTTFIDSIQEFAISQSDNLGQSIFSLLENDLSDTVVYQLVQDQWTSGLMNEIYRRNNIASKPSQFYARMRVKLGSDTSVGENQFHFDSSYLTLSVPIVVPSSDEGGELLVHPSPACAATLR